jgi:hypothetical protein
VTTHSPGPWTSTSATPVYHTTGHDLPVTGAPVGLLVTLAVFLAATGIALRFGARRT